MWAGLEEGQKQAGEREYSWAATIRHSRGHNICISPESPLTLQSSSLHKNKRKTFGYHRLETFESLRIWCGNIRQCVGKIGDDSNRIVFGDLPKLCFQRWMPVRYISCQYYCSCYDTPFLPMLEILPAAKCIFRSFRTEWQMPRAALMLTTPRTSRPRSKSSWGYSDLSWPSRRNAKVGRQMLDSRETCQCNAIGGGTRHIQSRADLTHFM